METLRQALRVNFSTYYCSRFCHGGSLLSLFLLGEEMESLSDHGKLYMTNFKSQTEMTFDAFDDDSSNPRAQSVHRTGQEARRFQKRAKILKSVHRT